MAGRRSAIRLEDGPVVLDAFQTAAEKVAHVEPVLFVKGTIQMELLPEGFLDLRVILGLSSPHG